MRWRSAPITAGLSPVARRTGRRGFGSFKRTIWFIWLASTFPEIFLLKNGSSIFQARSTARHFPTYRGQIRNGKKQLRCLSFFASKNYSL